MSHFTMEFHEAVHLTGGRIEFDGEGDNDTGHSRIVGGYIRLDRYPIFDEEYRPRLNGLIIDRYYNREIGLETPEKFYLQLRSLLNERMPYFNKLYDIARTEIDPLSTVDIKTVMDSLGATEQASTAKSTGERSSTEHTDADANTTSTSDTNGKSRSIFSEYPQQMLSGAEDYASNGTDANSQTLVTGTGTQASTSDVTQTGTTGDETEASSEATSTENVTSRRTGYEGYAPELLARYRDTITDIDAQVLGMLNPLFMSIWQSSNTYTSRGFHYGY